MRWASARALRTALAEQHERSASFSGSRQSSSVTATGSAPSSCAHSSAATALSTPPDIATSVRSALGVSAASAATAVPEGAGERVGGEVGRVQLAEAQAAERGGDLVDPDARGVEQRARRRRARPPRSRRRSSPRSPSASKPASVTRSPVDARGRSAQVTAGGRPGAGAVGPRGHVAAPCADGADAPRSARPAYGRSVGAPAELRAGAAHVRHGLGDLARAREADDQHGVALGADDHRRRRLRHRRGRR